MKIQLLFLSLLLILIFILFSSRGKSTFPTPTKFHPENYSDVELYNAINNGTCPDYPDSSLWQPDDPTGVVNKGDSDTPDTYSDLPSERVRIYQPVFADHCPTYPNPSLNLMSDKDVYDVISTNVCPTDPYYPPGCNTNNSCPFNAYCSVNTDCSSGGCNNGTCLAPPPFNRGENYDVSSGTYDPKSSQEYQYKSMAMQKCGGDSITIQNDNDQTVFDILRNVQSCPTPHTVANGGVCLSDFDCVNTCAPWGKCENPPGDGSEGSSCFTDNDCSSSSINTSAYFVYCGGGIDPNTGNRINPGTCGVGLQNS